MASDGGKPSYSPRAVTKLTGSVRRRLLHTSRNHSIQAARKARPHFWPDVSGGGALAATLDWGPLDSQLVAELS